MLMPSRASILMRTKRSQRSRAVSISGRRLRRRLFLNFNMSFTFMLMMTGFGGGDFAINQENVLKFVLGGRQDAGALVDFGRIEEVEDREMLHLENSVHALEAEATFAIEEIGDMSLSETGLRGQAQASQFSLFDALPQGLTKIVLESFEFHVPESTSCL